MTTPNPGPLRKSMSLLSRREMLLAMMASGCAAAGTSATKHNRLSSANRNLIGYSENRTNFPTRFENGRTTRAFVVDIHGTNRRELAAELVKEPNAWTQFAGWSPDGRQAVIGRGWETPENSAWEEKNKTFRMTEGWLYDMFLLDMETGKLVNVTAVERVSSYNTGIIFMPGDSNTLGFTALIDGISHPFLMDRNGRNKRDVTQGKAGFTYGFSASPDGKHMAYHKDYQVFVADADGSNARQITTGNPFNFVPQWSPDSQWLLFVSGEHYNCHPYIVHPDGSDLHKLADRGGYSGVMTTIDVPDFHGGSSDVPVWSTDGASVLYTCKIENAVELMRISLNGKKEQLTHSSDGVFNYHPKQSPDGKYIAFGSTQSGARRIYVMPATGGAAHAVTEEAPGQAAMWANWQPPVT